MIDKQPIRERLEPLGELFKVLADDIADVVGEASTDLSQTQRRAFIRALFALIEADTFNRKQMALILHEKGYIHFSDAELTLLREEQYELTDKGEIRTQTKLLKLAENIQFAMHCFCKATGIDYEIPKGGDGWRAFRKSIRIRNRITHPKHPNELVISNSDLNEVFVAFFWFKKNYEDITALLITKHSSPK